MERKIFNEESLRKRKMEKMKKANLVIIDKMVDKFLKLSQTEAESSVSWDGENEAVRVQLETADPGVLIGYHGRNLSSLQLILGVMVSQKIGQRVRVIVNVGDYREKREEVLQKMALSAAQKVHFSGEPVALDSLTAQERRIIHLVLSENSEVETSSEGEGRERRLVIKPRQGA